MEIVLLLVALLSTTTMTLFSYLISASFRDLYKEPVLLEYVMSELKMKISYAKMEILGWALHYLIGLVFILAYIIPVWLGYYAINWITGILFGCIIGLLGVLSWKMLFKLTKKTPIAHPLIYYIQLFFAHIIFGLSTVAIYILVS